MTLNELVYETLHNNELESILSDKMTPNTSELYATHIPALAMLIRLGWDYRSPETLMGLRDGSTREVLLRPILIDYLRQYRDDLADPTLGDSQFYTRADNLREYLKQVEKKLGSLSQRLSASVEAERVNTDLAGDKSASNSTPRPSSIQTRTSWWQLDNVFYEARGSTWALLHLLKAIEVDFASVLENKNALVSLQQIIKELEATQQTIWSPMILNGSGFGMLANHSLVMANYISRANAAIIELSELLNQG